jgi:arylsulfatase A-like enzyme
VRPTLALLALAGAALAVAPTHAADLPKGPNIVLILSDDMGFSDLGCFGGEIHTPNLDRLAANGLRFTQFYNTARCCPTRASLLTGAYPHQAGVGHMMEDKGLDGYRGDLSSRCATIPEALRPAGYRSYAVGKWHVTRHMKPDGPRHNWPLQRGFDRYYGTLTGSGSYYDPGTLTRDNTAISPFADTEYRPKDFYYTDAITDNATRFLAEHGRDPADQPFFLYVAYTAAHWPMQARERDIARYRGRYDAGYEPIRKARFERAKKLGVIAANCELAPTAGEWDKVKNKAWEARCMEVYAAMVEVMDEGVGRIVAELERQKRLDDTLILFLQDNGGCAEAIGRSPNVARPDQPAFPPIPADAVRSEVRPRQTREGMPMLTGKGVMPGPADTFIAYGEGWANVSNTPFREYKHWVHEGGISTPLLAHWPARIKAKGELRHQPGHLIDLMATCLDVAGAKPLTERDGEKLLAPEGKSLVPAFDGKPIERDALFWEHEGNRAVRAGKWKLVAKGPAAGWELYDLEADRAELHDLAARHPEQARELAAKWEAWAKRANVLPWPWKPAYGEGAKDEKGPKPPGVVIDHVPATSNQYVGSPSLAVLPDGELIATHDLFGPGSSKDRTVVFASVNGGKNWERRAEISGQWWSGLFPHKGALYLMGTSKEYGHVVIRRSDDNGRTWTTPKDRDSGLLLDDGKYHTAPVPVVFHQGRVWRGMEDAQGPGGWGSHFRSFLMSAPADADLLKAASWTCSNRLGRDPVWLGGKFGGWLEGNAVVAPDGRVVNLLRVDHPTDDGNAALVTFNEDGTKASFDPEKGFINFPGGAKKFTIRYDPTDKCYWSLTNPVLEQHRGERPGRVRNALALCRSEDLRTWEVRCVLLYHPDVQRHGFQYADWQFDGDDLIAVVRTAFDDAEGGAHNQHDANYLTFHRFGDFRRLTSKDSVPTKAPAEPPPP